MIKLNLKGTIVTVASVVLIQAAPVQAAALQARLIFSPQDKHVHGSSVVEAPNGDFLACWYHGSGERTANDVVIQGARLSKGASEWSPVFGMADTPNLPDCNPVLFVDRRDRLWLFWVAVRANRWERSILKYRVADDYQHAGAPRWSWQDVITLQPGEAFAQTIQRGFQELKVEAGLWTEYSRPFSEQLLEAARDPVKRQEGWMTRIHPLQLPNGRILLPLYSDGFEQALIGISDDDGQTWRASLPIVGLGASQPTLVRRRDGTLVAYHRDNGGAPKRVAQATSTDNGESWSVARDTDLPNPGSSLEVISLADGRWAMIYNDTERGRHDLAMALSDDEGRSWKWKRHLERGERGRGGFSYPSMIQARDGRLHATYTYGVPEGRSIKHVAFDADWIEQGD